jgi:predicted dehydrogenase
VLEGSYGATLDQLRWRGLVEVVAASDIRLERRAVAEARFGALAFSTDYRAVVEAPNVDLVMVLTSMNEHGPVAAAALEAGKHVLVEKPMATSLEQAARLLELARRGPGMLYAAPFTVLSATYRAIQQHIRAGDIGTPRLARARYGHGGPTWGPWFYRPGGGPLFDLGVYNVTTLTGLLGPARRVSGMGGIAVPERIIDGQPLTVEIEDTMQVTIDFGGSTFAVITTGFTMQRYRGPAVEVYGSTGTVQMLGDDFAPEGYELWRNSVGAWQVSPRMDRLWFWTDGLNHAVRCISGGARQLVTPEHAYHVLEIMIRAHEAARSGQALSIESSFTPPTFEE